MVGLVGQASAAWLLPSQFLVQDDRIEPPRGQTFGREGSRRTPPENGDTLHLPICRRLLRSADGRAEVRNPARPRGPGPRPWAASVRRRATPDPPGPVHALS